MTPSGTRAVFLDRDGTIIEDVHYLADPDHIRWLPGAIEALKLIADHGFLLVVITNQSGVARGFFGEELIKTVHARLESELEALGVRVAGWYYCPHHPSEGRPPYRQECGCRKPRPGMVLRAARELGIDLSRSYTVGDSLRDVECGLNAGTSPILVETGKGTEEKKRARHDVPGIEVFPTLLDAARWICSRGVEV